jgi:hypothetical protein
MKQFYIAFLLIGLFLPGYSYATDPETEISMLRNSSLDFGRVHLAVEVPAALRETLAKAGLVRPIIVGAMTMYDAFKMSSTGKTSYSCFYKLAEAKKFAGISYRAR